MLNKQPISIKTIDPNNPYKEQVICGQPYISETEPEEKWEGLIWKTPYSDIPHIYIGDEWVPLGQGITGNEMILDFPTEPSAYMIWLEPCEGEESHKTFNYFGNFNTMIIDQNSEPGSYLIWLNPV